MVFQDPLRPYPALARHRTDGRAGPAQKRPAERDNERKRFGGGATMIDGPKGVQHDLFFKLPDSSFQVLLLLVLGSGISIFVMA